MALINTTIISKDLVAARAARETVAGVAETLVAGDGVMMRNFSITPIKAEHKDSNIVTGSAANTPKFLSYILAEASFEIELAGSGDPVVAPASSIFLTASGWDEYTESDHMRYQMTDDIGGQDTFTFEVKIDDRLYVMTGCRGSSKIIIMEDERMVAQFKVVGIYSTPTSTTFSRVDYSNFERSLLINPSNVALCQQKAMDVVTHKIEFDVNANVARLPAVNQEIVTATEINPTMTSTIRLPRLAAWNIEQDIENGAEYWTKFILGDTEGAIVEFDAYSQLLNIDITDETPRKANLTHHPIPDATTSGAVLRFK